MIKKEMKRWCSKTSKYLGDRCIRVGNFWLILNAVLFCTSLGLGCLEEVHPGPKNKSKMRVYLKNESYLMFSIHKWEILELSKPTLDLIRLFFCVCFRYFDCRTIKIKNDFDCMLQLRFKIIINKKVR